VKSRLVQRFSRRFSLVLASLACLLPVAWAQDADAVWIIPIDTQITPATASFVTSRIELANEGQPLALLLQIDTPGGRVDSMQVIVDALLNDAQVPVVAVVQNAFSAGALIAMAGEQLAMLPGSSIGAALPITIGLTGSNPTDEKTISALRGQFRSVAEARGRNVAVAEAMVDPAKEVPGLATNEELVTLSAEEAVSYDIADVVATDLQDALAQFGYAGAATEVLERNLRENLGTWLSGPIVAGILLILGIGGLLLEFFTPGFGIPGAIGIVALFLFATSTLIATPTGTLDVLLIIVGIVLLAIEAFVTPGFGVAGILGISAIIWAVVRIFQGEAVTVLATTTIGGGILLGVLLWLLPTTGLGKRLTLSTRLGRSDGSLATAGAGLGSSSVGDATGYLVADRSDLHGKTGTAMSDLRPAGIARIGDERVDVVSDGDYIPSGATILVRHVEGNRVTVREVTQDRSNQASSEDADNSRDTR